MAKSNDITFYPNATAKCTNCASVYTLGSTIETLSVEICGNCHPFYTGKAILVDTAGRIDKFNTRLGKVQTTAKVAKSKTRKQVQSLSDLMTDEPTAPATTETESK
jgi:large subunit ribosomal protein L31